MRRIETVLLCAAMLILLTTGSEALADDAALAKGKATYKMYCEMCHGESGDGKSAMAANLDPKPRDFTAGDFKYGGTDQDIFDVISNGAASKGGSQMMAAWGSVISEDDLWALVKYVRTLKK